MESKLTPSQEKGVKITDRDLCMVAGPGSGKTSVLVERFVNIVTTQKASINEILTLTFTDKAANEMRVRVASSFEQKGMERERQEIEFAFLSTIHSFCARLLRENAVEAGVDPQFRVMDELEADRIKECSLEETLKKWGERGALDTFLNEIFWKQSDSKRGRSKSFKDNLILLHEKIRSASVPVSKAVILPDLSRDIIHFYETIRELIRSIKGIQSEKKITPKSREKIKQVLDSWKTADLQKSIDALCTKSEGQTPLTAPCGGGIYRTDGSTHLNKERPEWDKVTRTAIDKIKDVHSSIHLSVSKEAKRHLSPLREELNALTALLVERYSWRIKMVVREFLMDFDNAYMERKRSECFVDFTDLEEKTIGLLQDNAYIRNEIQQKFKFILVDEFQDTSRLQKRIIDLIRGEENLFVVGDAKQSIYGFRNADVEIFQEMQREMAPGALIRLNENFRSRPQVLDFINHVFNRLWPEGSNERHGECNPEKDTNGCSPPSPHNVHQLKAGAKFSKKPFPSIEIVVADGGDKFRARKRESTEIARRIREIVDQGEITITNKREEKRKVSYKDFAILFRSTTDIKLYEQSLSQFEIPYYVVSGRGFFNTSEIRDMINFLKVIESPLDELNLAAVLKSPFAGIDDDALFWLSDHAHRGGDGGGENSEYAHRTREKRLLYHALAEVEAIQEIDTASKERIVRFTQLLNEVQEVKPRTQLWQLISFILRKTEFQSKMLLFSNGKKRYANLLKFVELCKIQEDFKSLVLRDFIRIVEGYRFKEIRESEAPVESEEDDVVRLITTHSAKGLEFPIVIVADLDRDNTRPSDYLVFSKNHGVSFKIINPSTNEVETPLSYEQIHQETAEKELQESKRLLFVAMTRAQEHLILTGATNRSKAKGGTERGNWFGYVSSALCLDNDLGETPITIRLDTKNDGSDTIETLEIRYTWIKEEDDDPPLPGRQGGSEGVKEVERVKLLTRYQREIEAGNEINTPSPQKVIVDMGENIVSIVNYAVPVDYSHYLYTVTEILKFHFCPRLYYLNSILGLQGVQERDWTASESDGDGSEMRDDEIPCHELGTIVHRVFARYHFSENSRKLKKYIEKELLVAGFDPCRKNMDIITGWVHSFYRSSVGEEVIISKHQRREISFIFHYNEFPLRGQIDLLYITDENRVKIVDYKANDITVDAIPDKIRDYTIQMQLYSRALEAIYGKNIDEAILYFLVPDRSVIIDTSVNASGELDTVLDQFFTSQKNGVFKRAGSDKCRWCEFGRICEQH